MDQNKLSTRARKFFNLIEFDENEQLICEIRKHPIGLIIIYVSGFLIASILFITLVGGALFLRDDVLGPGMELGAARSVMVLLGGLLSLLALAITAIGGYLYKSNVVIITSEKIAQILYRTIFDRKISQLSIGDVQDVTVTQKGIVARFFDYGTIVIETAGEQQNYTFSYAPQPYQCAKDIIGAHERDVAKHGN